MMSLAVQAVVIMYKQQVSLNPSTRNASMFPYIMAYSVTVKDQMLILHAVKTLIFKSSSLAEKEYLKYVYKILIKKLLSP